VTTAGRQLLVLASSSPQRRAILERLGVGFVVVEPQVEELTEGDPAAVACANAERKAQEVAGRLAASGGAGGEADGPVVLGADTLVTMEGVIYGKPADEAQARAMLSSLGGRWHTVVGGVSILAGGEQLGVCAQTRVSFRPLDEATIDWYLARGEWRGRAGGYAIQGAGAALVREIAGDYENVVGLPLAAVLDAYPQLLRS